MVDISLNAKPKWGRVTRKTLRNMIELKNPNQVKNVDPNRLYRQRFFKVKSTSGEWLIGDMGNKEANMQPQFLRPRLIGS